jgi:hypothetical protein
MCTDLANIRAGGLAGHERRDESSPNRDAQFAWRCAEPDLTAHDRCRHSAASRSIDGDATVRVLPTEEDWRTYVSTRTVAAAPDRLADPVRCVALSERVSADATADLDGRLRRREPCR